MKFMPVEVFLETAYRCKSGITGTCQKWHYTRPVEHGTVEMQNESILPISVRIGL